MNYTPPNVFSTSSSTRSEYEPRTIVHAGPLLLAKPHGTESLERYLSWDDRRDLVLIHDGQSSLRDVADTAGVQGISLGDGEGEREAETDEAERAAQMAVAMGAEIIEFTIARPGLTTAAGNPIQMITSDEAERFARTEGLRTEIREKIRAGCAVLREGIRRVRIGNPMALLQGFATVIVPSTGSALSDVCLPDAPRQSGDEAPKPDRDPARLPIELPRAERPRALPAFAPSRPRVRRMHFSPRLGCTIGPRTRNPFPSLRTR